MSVTINGDTGIDKITDGSIVAADIGAGEITDAKLASGIDAAKLTGTLPALDASSLTGIPAPAALSTASGSAPSYSARAWVNFNGTGTVAIRASGNVSSITDHAVGDYTVNFTNAMPDVNYATSVSVTTPSVAQRETGQGASPAATATTSFRFYTLNNVGGVVDCIATSVAIFR